ncbi:unnamed protein product [Rotaria magnacalcarata]|uniref:RCC1-like domain-containing protein n=3 Tax=Rotaria magnacalcarata TaxID=392030 RepID=A0A818YND7_9BILA|nr:unnamed protein product [Rotaria magnacalcarata]CAF2080381.1 unnamed protein product [Rotaria magnacalcarata]CAF3752402.1 unnamed protein product [Rotaria magnacalcarata]CAF3764415.1 unnamed protein product [Rotaria magnacalcarata]
MEIHENSHNAPTIHLFGKTYLTKNEEFYIPNDPIIHMAAGDRHTIIITESGRVFAFGDNDSGQLGLGHTNRTNEISTVKTLDFTKIDEKVILAACGRESSLLATNHGALYAFGSNNRYQLGIELRESKLIYPHPVRIEYFRSRMSWKQIAMGAEHTCALNYDGKVYVWGSNEDGQCGLARKQNVIKTPTELKLQYFVNTISCGYYHTGLVVKSGRLFLFGNNRDRQLGCSIPDQYIRPLEVSLPGRVKAVACGNQHTVVLTEKGEVYTCGRGEHGQLGLGRKISNSENFKMIENLPKNLTTIAAGKAHTTLLGLNGELYVFGDGKYGKLGCEMYSNKFEPCSVDTFKGLNVLKVVCGGDQTIVIAQKKRSQQDEEDIENTLNSITESMKTIHHRSRSPSMTNYMSRVDQSIETCHQYVKLSRNSLSYIRSNSDPDDSSVFTESSLMSTKYEKTTDESSPTSTYKNNEDLISLKTSASNRTIPLITITDEFTKSGHRFSSLDETLYNRISLNGCMKNEVYSDSGTSSSNERSLPMQKQSFKTISLCEADININEHLNPKVLSKYYQHNPDGTSSPQSASSTTSSCTSSSMSSTDYENLIISSNALYALQNNFMFPTVETPENLMISNSEVDVNKTQIKGEPQTGFYSRALSKRSTRKSSTNTNKASRTCVLM